MRKKTLPHYFHIEYNINNINCNFLIISIYREYYYIFFNKIEIR